MNTPPPGFPLPELDDRPEAERWRNICVGVEALLKQQDIDTDEHRQSIDNEGYWAVEADCLESHTDRLESELLDGPLALDNTRATSGTKNSSALALKPGKGSNVSGDTSVASTLLETSSARSCVL
ncbi:hypothetical protein MHUMG1_09555 [Metarhizium humberi]|uniref:Uncharacterized protein n=1 Tax=Metarhizium humberi TaxID=2596975 RepID=A0A9P8M352_9HYPO|nr:hypothetical protein MHUMG1_09555 [Metarhizium humberi]